MSVIFETVMSVIEELRNDPRIVIDELLINPPADTEKLMEETRIPSILAELYAKVDGLVLAWHVKDDPFIKGGIVIPLLENIHATRWSAFGMLDFNDDVHAYFNKRSAEDSRVVAESLEGDEDVEFQDIAGGVVSIRDYFEAFRKTRGFRFWQENYSSRITYTLDAIIENRGYLWGDNGIGEITLRSAHVPN